MITKEWSTEIVYFMTPGAGVLMLGRGHISFIMKMDHFFNEESIKILSFLTPGAGGLVSGRG